MAVRPLALWLALALAPLLAYSSSLGNGYVWDDHKAIERGLLIGSLRNVPTLFVHDTMYNSLGGKHERSTKVDTYRPLTMTTFFIERALFGLRPWAFHADNALLHAGNVLLLAGVAARLGLSAPAAALAALLFAVHPSISEAVHWINGRSDPLCVLFFLLALRLWLDEARAPSRSPWRALAVALLLTAATLCKETAFLLAPPLLLLAPRLFPSTRGLLRALLPWVAGMVLGSLCRLLALRRPAVADDVGHILHAMTRVPLIWIDGLRSLVLPAPDIQPSLFEAYFQVSAWRVLGAATIVALLVLGAAWRWRRGQPLWAWGLCTFLLTMAPVALLTFNEGWAGWGRYLYPSATVLAIPCGAALMDRLYQRASPRARRGMAGAAMAAITLLGIETFAAGHAWRDDRTLAMAQIADHPELSTGHSNLAVVEANAGHPERALPLLQHAVDLAPRDNYQHFSRMAWALIRVGRRQEAFAAARRTLALEPDDPNARYIRALDLIGQGRQADAAALLLALVTEDPSFQGPWDTMAEAVRRLGVNSEFTSVLRAALSDPHHAAISARLHGLL